MRFPLNNAELLERACTYNKDTMKHGLDQQMMLMMVVSMIHAGELNFNALDAKHRHIVIALNDTYKYIQRTSTNEGEKRAWEDLRCSLINNERVVASIRYYIAEARNGADINGSVQAFANDYIALQKRTFKQDKPITLKP